MGIIYWAKDSKPSPEAVEAVLKANWSYNERTKCWEKGEGADKREVKAFGQHLAGAGR